MDEFEFDEFDDLDDLEEYCMGSFIFQGQIYIRIDADDDEAIKELQSIFDNHVDFDIKLMSAYMAIEILMLKIQSKYCSS